MPPLATPDRLADASTSRPVEGSLEPEPLVARGLTPLICEQRRPIEKGLAAAGRLSTPWKGDCLFCGIVAGDVPAQIVDSDEHTVSRSWTSTPRPAVRLVVPRAHATDLDGHSDEDLEHAMVAARRSCGGSMRPGPDGFNVLNACRPAAWQTDLPLPPAVIPRYDDDPLKLPWIPRGGEPEEIAAVAERIGSERGL